MKLGHAVCLASVLVIATSGCAKSDAAERRDGKSSVERNDQIAITTRDGSVTLALTKANRVAMRPSDSLRHAVNSEVAREFAGDSADTAFGRWIQRTTANLVSKGMSIEVTVPVDEIEDVRYDDGEIRFDHRSDRRLKFHSFKRDGRSLMTEFDPKDAERFVAAVKKELAARR